MRNSVKKFIKEQIKEYKKIGIFDENTYKKCQHFYYGYCSMYCGDSQDSICNVFRNKGKCPFNEPKQIIEQLETALKKMK